MADSPKHQAFFCLRLKDGDDTYTHFSYGQSLDRLKEWANQKGEKEEKADLPGEGEQASAEEPRSESYALSDLTNRVVDTGLALSELVLATSSVKGIFSTIISRSEVVDPVKEQCPIVDEGIGYTIYGISADRLSKIKEQHRRLERIDRGFDLLLSAVLLAMIATFDSNISDVVRQMLSLRPERVDSAERVISVADVLAMSSFDEVRARLLDDEIYLFSRGSHEEQVKYIEKSFHVEIIKSWKRWPDFIEIFERRNLIAHGEKTFTKRYVDICKRHGHKGSESVLGNNIELTRSYLAQALDTLMEFGILLIFSIWRKQFSAEEKQAFESINEVSYRLILAERYRLPANIIEYVLSLKNVNVSQAVRLMLIVNLASAYKHWDKAEKCQEVLSSVDWSAAADNYSMCVSALRGEVDDVVRKMELVVKAGIVGKNELREWPALDGVRSEAAFQNKFLELFEEPLTEATSEPSEIDTAREEGPAINGSES